MLKEFFSWTEVNDGIANSLVAQMLYLDSDDNTKPIYLYINSPGGSVTAGLAIYDTIKYVKSDVVTICVGLAASMGAFLLAAGTKGKKCTTSQQNNDPSTAWRYFTTSSE